MSNPTVPRHSVATRSATLLAAAAVVASLALGGAVSAQAASASLTASPSTATAGGLVLLSATGITPGDALTFDLDGDALATSALAGSTETADSNGDYDGDAWMPDDVTVGTHTVSVSDSSGSTVASTTVSIVPRPTATVTPATAALTDYLATGVSATFTGFAPGETVSFGVSSAASGTQLPTTAVADAAGQVTVSYVPQAGSVYAQVGTFQLLAATGDLSIVSEPVSFEVTVDAAPVAPTPAAPTPAAPTPLAAAAGSPAAPVATPVKRAATFAG